nr:DUF3592 domain-containing protein [Caballeronia sp. SL2Y3]
MFCIQLSFLPNTIEFVRVSKVAFAEVVKLNAGGKHPEVAFTTSDGQRISVPTSSWFHSVDVGDKVEIRYDPRQPGNATMNTLFGVWSLHLFCGVPAMVLILSGLLGFPRQGWGVNENDD